MKSYTKAVKDIAITEQKEMYEILSNYFDGTSFDEFIFDLLQKELAIFIEKNSKIVGFSTLVCRETSVAKELVYVVFSGDTIVEKEHRNSSGLGVEMAKYFDTISHRFPKNNVYYLLTTKGWRTYKFLPFVFNAFYPRFNTKMPQEIKNVMDVFCKKKYGRRYDGQTSRILSDGEGQRIASKNLYDGEYPARDNVDIDFFFKNNAGYLSGDELVCIASLDKSNITKRFKRLSR